MPDLLETIRSDIAGRLTELRPAVEEHAALEAALAALGTAPRMHRTPARRGASRAPQPALEPPPRPPAAGTTPVSAPGPTPPRNARPATGEPTSRAGTQLPPVQPGSRPAQILAAVTAEPGLQPSTVADRLKIDAVSLGYLVDGLEHAGHLDRRDDGGLYRTDASLSAAA